jgi:hypothetical protein
MWKDGAVSNEPFPPREVKAWCAAATSARKLTLTRITGHDRRQKHRAGLRLRMIEEDVYRPVHHLKQAEVWDLFKKYQVNPHPAYKKR